MSLKYEISLTLEYEIQECDIKKCEMQLQYKLIETC